MTFRVWAPAATNVAVRGQFNGWSDLTMAKDTSTGYWSASDTNARPGQEYKYVLKRQGDTNEYWKHDPRAVWIRNGNSVIYDQAGFSWGTNEAPVIPVGRQVMYEMHIGTFYDPDASDSLPGTFDDAIGRLGYLKNLGVNVIALMPVAEFGGAFSWGYNPEHIFAVESAYGGPDGLKRLVRAAHELGMKVQVDVVHNHWNAGSDGLWEFDGTGNAYFYPDEARGWTPWGRRPNYSEPEVRRYIRDNVQMLLEDFRIDGLRWDSPQNMLGYDTNATTAGTVGNPQTVLPDGKSLLMEINRMIHEEHPGHWSIAEDADLLAVNATYSGFPGADFYQALVVTNAADSFDGHWQTSFHNIVTPEVASATPDVGLIRQKVTEWSEPPGYRVIFSDNHDKAGDLNGNKRLAERMMPADPTGATARKRTLLNAALTLTAPGVPMLLMGQEFHATGSFSSGTPDRNARLDWREASARHRIFRAHRDLALLRESVPGLQGANFDGAVSGSSGDVLLLWRRDESGSSQNDAVVLLNFGAQESDWRVNFPSSGIWHTRFNSDWRVYGADFSDVGPGSTVSVPPTDMSATVRIAPYSALVFTKLAPSIPANVEDTDGNGLPDGWQEMFGVTGAVADSDADGLSDLSEYQRGLDPLEKDYAQVVYSGSTNEMRAISNNPVVQHLAWAVDPVSVVRPSSFTFLSNSIPGPFFTNRAGGYLRFSFDLVNSNSAFATFVPNTNLAVVDTNRTNWAAYHGVTNFGENPDGDGFDNLQEFARGSDPNASNRAAICLAGDQYGWDPSANGMTFIGETVWILDLPRRGALPGSFKFTVGDWSSAWGETGVPPDGIADASANGQQNITNAFDHGNGIYRFRFDETTLAYQITYDPTDADADGIQDAWVAYHGLSGSGALATNDSDGDGWSNLSEFLRFANRDGTLMNPTLSDSNKSPKRMTVTGGTLPMPIWTPAATNMTWSDQRTRWEWTATFAATTNIQFKFSQATNNANWFGGESWGWSAGSNTPGFAVPGGPSNMVATVTNGVRYRFAFNDLTGVYTISNFPVSGEWWETNGLPLPLPANSADPRWTNDDDGDGHSLLVEYALGGNPRMAEASGLTSSSTTNIAGTNRLILRWLQRTNGGGSVVLAPQALSGGLVSGSWTNLTASNSALQTNLPPGFQRREASTPFDGAAKFLRLRVSGP